MFSFFCGVYFAGFVMSFLVTAFFVGLGGKDSDIWKIFIYPLFWPIFILYKVLKIFFA